jgi:hypothetical protein
MIDAFEKIHPTIAQTVLPSHQSNIGVMFFSTSQCILHVGNFCTCKIDVPMQRVCNKWQMGNELIVEF